MTDHIIQRKKTRIQAGSRPRVLDLFSGCGGLSLGFKAAGFEILTAMENNATAAASYGANFHRDDAKNAIARDLTSTTPGELVRALRLGLMNDAFDVIIGGPPCQAFARVGRSKLRKIDAHPEAFLHDPRARLYGPYLDYVKSCRPVAILMENVPDIMNFGGHNIPEEVCNTLEEQGYVCAYTLLNAAFYGVPQMRERMYLIAYHREVADTISFPAPTHWIELPPGYEGSRQVALKVLSTGSIFDEVQNYVDPPEATDTLFPAVTAEEAIGDLPEIDARELVRRGVLKRGARRFDKLIAYDDTRTVSSYAYAMKDWAGFEAGKGIYDHVIRFLPRDYPLFECMKEADQYPEAHKRALRMFEERLFKIEKQGVRISPGSGEYEELKRSIVPPYDASKFPNKWRKISRDQPVRTIMAHLSKDGYSHIHYDSAQARTISVREAARLQSFPDGFTFAGSMNQAFQQIGNAVPPLMAKAIAVEIMKSLQTSESGRHSWPPRQIAVGVDVARFGHDSRMPETEVEA